MSLYGALFSGVSGLTAQSSAMGAISDNITNVSTIGYKGTSVNFQTLVTKQTSSTFYSAGGVQSKPRQQTDVQGLLQASTSQTDLSMSGGGFFVVNGANVPGISDPYLFTRAGSFIQDDQGYLKNSQGYYLQGWPTDAGGSVVPANSALTITNQNIISTDYLESINLNRVGGTAASTTSVAIGANLPSSDTTGTTHKTDVQFFNSLGNANNMSIVYTKTSTGNQWDVGIAPPPGTAVATLYDKQTTPAVYASGGLVEFTAIPAQNSTIKIGFTTALAKTYKFTTTPVAATDIDISTGQTLSQVVASLVAKVKAQDQAFAVDTNRIHVKSGVTTAVEFTESGVGNIFVDLSSTLSSTGAAVTKQTGTFTVNQQANAYSDYTLFRFGATLPTDGDTMQINGKTYTFDMNGTNALPSATPTIKTGTAEVIELTVSGGVETGDTYTVNLDGAGLLTYTVLASDTTVTNIATGIAAMINANAANAAVATATVTGTGVITLTATEAQRGRAISAVVANVTDTGVASNFAQTATTTANVAPVAIATLASLLSAMETSIEGNDTVLATTGSRVKTFDLDNDGSAETLYIATVTNDANDVVTSGITAAARPVDGDSTAYTSTTIPVATAAGIVFSADGLPSTFNVGALEVMGFADGAQNMSDATNEGKRITLDFGTVGEANGLTQFGAEFTPAFITQNGSKFGTFAGVTIGTDGLVTALFDNGETRKIFQIPVATFVNPNQLDSKSGNVWSATQFSGDYTLRVADTGPAGQVVQSALEASTVDIGAEFTNMIVVQRAYSASTKIISTADQMLEELMRVKR